MQEDVAGVDQVELLAPDFGERQVVDRRVAPRDARAQRALAEPERLAIRRWNPSDDWVNSYMTNGTLRCIPERMNNGWQCVNPRRDYQNDVRLNLTASNVVEIRAAYTNFTQGIAKICALPEYFPGEIKGEYTEQALYGEHREHRQASGSRHRGQT